MTPQQYLRDYRVQQACRMLAHTTRPMGAVAELSGLGSARAITGQVIFGRRWAMRANIATSGRIRIVMGSQSTSL